MKIWEKILLICALLSLVTILLVRTLGASSTQSLPPVSRTIHPGVAFLGDKIYSELRVDANALPACPTQADLSPVYVSFVIDHSGSMAGDPLAEARNSASDFADLMNLTKDGDQASVVMFSDYADLVTGFSTDRAKVINAIQGIPDGMNTDMAAGLILADKQFKNLTLPTGARPLIILLSDGQSDPNAAITISNQIKSQGIRLVTIALGEADPQLLSQIATSSSDYYAASDPSALMEIYGEIAQGVVGTSATNLTVVENVNDKDFNLVGGFYRAQQNAGQLTWSIPFVGRRGRSVGYFLQPKTMGWLTVSPKDGQISLTDCNGQAVTNKIPSGQHVLVIFPIWILFIAPFLVLLWALARLISMLRNRRQAPAASRPGERQATTSQGSKIVTEKKPTSGSDVTHGRQPPPKR